MGQERILWSALHFSFHTLVCDSGTCQRALAAVYLGINPEEIRSLEKSRRLSKPQRRDGALLNLIPIINWDTSGIYFQDWRLESVFKFNGYLMHQSFLCPF